MIKRCLYCYLPLQTESENDFHSACSKKIFGTALPPILAYTEKDLEQLGNEFIKTQMAVTGVQPKLSLHITSGDNKEQPKKLTIVGLWGGYILKPPTDTYPQLPEIEDLTMHLARIAKITTVPHSLIRLQSGNLAYITKRIDRVKKAKLPMEDMCQITNRLTEEKYNGSYEQIAKAILKHSVNPGLDVVNFFEQVLFCFVTGSADMHLKNFSLIYQPNVGYQLSLAYDMLATSIANPQDDEDLALTLNGKKKKIKAADFVAAFTTLHLETKQQENIFSKIKKAKQKWFDWIDISFLSDDFKEAYKSLIQQKLKLLELEE